MGLPFGDGRIEDCGFAAGPPDASGTRSVSRRFRDSSADVRMPSSWSITSPGRMPALATAKAPYAGRLTYTQTWSPNSTKLRSGSPSEANLTQAGFTAVSSSG